MHGGKLPQVQYVKGSARTGSASRNLEKMATPLQSIAYPFHRNIRQSRKRRHDQFLWSQYLSNFGGSAFAWSFTHRVIFTSL